MGWGVWPGVGGSVVAGDESSSSGWAFEDEVFQSIGGRSLAATGSSARGSTASCSCQSRALCRAYDPPLVAALSSEQADSATAMAQTERKKRTSTATSLAAALEVLPLCQPPAVAL